MNILFAEQKPSNELFSFAHSYWFGNFNVNNEMNFSQLALPNGCIELIIHLTDAHCNLRKNGSWSKSPEYTILGLHVKPYKVKFNNNVKAFGIRFYPDGIQNIFGVTSAEFMSTYENSADVFGGNFKDFCDRIRELKTPESQRNYADVFLKANLSSNRLKHDYTHFAMDKIRKAGGMVDYQWLLKQLPLGSRQMQRHFKNQYGITISDYVRLSRINVIHNYMLSKNQTLTELSYELNFTDQSHMIREFKNYAGVAPKKFLKSKRSIYHKSCGKR